MTRSVNSRCVEHVRPGHAQADVQAIHLGYHSNLDTGLVLVSYLAPPCTCARVSGSTMHC